MYAIADIQEIIQAEILQMAGEEEIAHLAIDSRKISFAGTALFFAIATRHRDGHDYLKQAYQKGVRNFIVSKKITVTAFPHANILFVPDVLLALQTLAAQHRKKFNFPVIGITGSNGKTIVKEWLFQLLHTDFTIVRSPRSYNSQIGVPLSIWNIQPSHNLGIFEAGISAMDEMQVLEKMIAPDIGILTNIGTAHSEGFDSAITKLNEKLKLFQNSKLLVYCNNTPWIAKAVEACACDKICWGQKDADLRIVDLDKTKTHTVLSLEYKKQTVTLSLHFRDDASIENVMHCICILLHLHYGFEKISLLLQQLEPVAMRLEQKKGIGNSVLINDSYSNDTDSLQIALDYLNQQNPGLRKTIVLTDFLQTRQPKETLYQLVATLLSEKNIHKMIGIGKDLYRYQYLFNKIPAATFYTNMKELLSHFQASDFTDQAILLKGARAFQVEQLAALLEEKVHQTILEIHLGKVTENVKKHQSLLAPQTGIMAIVKAFGYGSGATEVATVLQNLHVNYLAVAYADEGVALRKAGIHLPVMVMNTDEAAFDVLIEYDLEPELFSISILKRFLHFAAKNALVDYPVHLKLDTGMHRLGFEEAELADLIKLLKSDNCVLVKTVFSHLVGSEDPGSDAFTLVQNELFTKLCNQLVSGLGYAFIRHLANSAAIERHPYLQHDMVRIGIGMYGVTNNQSLFLQQVATLKTTIAQIKTVSPPETVGYNRKGIVNRTSIIATVRIGYADGYNRQLGNGRGKMLVNGRFAPTIGNICMDMTMLDITGIPDVQEEDYVIVFGENLPVMELANWCNTIPYEILTGISQRVKRIYLGE